MPEIYVETVDLDKDKAGEEPTAKDDSAAIKDADEETAAGDPLSDKKLDLLANLGVVHAENQIELHKELTRVHREMHLAHTEIKSTVDDLGAFRQDTQKTLTEIVEALDELLNEKDKASELSEEDETDASDTVIGRAYSFGVRCLGVGLLVWLIAVAIVKVFPEGV